jgi:hypothetical protein
MNLFPPKKQFVLSPGQEESRITFCGYEWCDLEQASRMVTDVYHGCLAVEIFGRAFILSCNEVQKIARTGIPFKLGFYQHDHVEEIVCNVKATEGRFQWIKEEECEVTIDWVIVEHDNLREPTPDERAMIFGRRWIPLSPIITRYPETWTMRGNMPFIDRFRFLWPTLRQDGPVSRGFDFLEQ